MKKGPEFDRTKYVSVTISASLATLKFQTLVWRDVLRETEDYFFHKFSCMSTFITRSIKLTF